MADTKKVFVRLVRGFPAGVTHRRGGVELTAGPSPVEAEVDKDQLAALESDANVEIVDKKEADKWAKYSADAPSHPSADELASDEGGESARNYEGGADTTSTASEGSGGSTGATSEKGSSSKQSGKKA